MDDTYSIVSGIEDQENLYSSGGGKRKAARGKRITYVRDGKRITYTRPSRSRSASRSRSRSRSRGPCGTDDKIKPGTCGFPTMAQVDQYSDDGQNIRKTVNGVTRYLESDPMDGQYYWVKGTAGRQSQQLGEKLSTRSGGKMNVDIMTMFMWLQKQKAAREMGSAMASAVNLDDDGWNEYTKAFNNEYNPKSFATSQALGTCVHSTTFVGEKFQGTEQTKHTFVWKGDLKVQEDQAVLETCQNIMFFGVVEKSEDLFRYTSMPGDANLLGRDICNALYDTKKNLYQTLNANYNAIAAVLRKPQYMPTGSMSMIVLQKINDGGYPKMNVYKFARGGYGAKPRFFLVPKDATRENTKELVGDMYTIPDNIGGKDSQLHIVCGNALFMGNSSQGFLDWFFANETGKITAKTVSPGNCAGMAEAMARKYPNQTVTVMYAVIDEAGVDSAVTVFGESDLAATTAATSLFTEPPGPPGPVPDANTIMPPVATSVPSASTTVDEQPVDDDLFAQANADYRPLVN